MEKEIKTKTIKYGAAAAVIAILLTAFAYNFGVQPIVQPSSAQLRTFTSYEEMQSFLEANMEKAQGFSSQYQIFGSRGAEDVNLAEQTKAAPEYSTTNIQVAGVDEADIVKTDGNYLYIVSGSNIYIVGADPSSTSTFQLKISLNETYNLEIYINENKLVVLGIRYPYPIYKATTERVAIYPYVYTEEVVIKVYDLLDITDPILTRSATMNGTLAGSRMIGNYIYATIVQPAIRPVIYQEPPSSPNETQPVIMLPQITTGGTVKEIQPTEIKYADITDVSYYFTTILAVNVLNDAQEPTHETFLASTGSLMYVSQTNMYLTLANTNWWFVSTSPEEAKQETLVYRVKLDNEKIVFEAKGAVSGYVLNQFSMDEYNGFFRVATTNGWGTMSTNNLYVLNMSLGIVGKLEDLAQGERIYSARFMGDRAYVVTFRQIDPFFVIDLSNPTEPKVLGNLKIPGFSGYLHPYDGNHVIGLGKQDGKVKLSLFDVTNVTAPTEAVPSYIVQGLWSDSTAIYDHKAFLFDKSKQLLALPISLDLYYSNYRQGEYVFNISLTDGFVFKGNVTHQGSGVEQWDSGYWVKRALYIDNVLYTVSDKKVKMNSLTDLSFLKEIGLI